MKRFSFIVSVWMIAGIGLVMTSQVCSAFNSVWKETLSAEATTTGAVPLTITAASLPDQAFFGKNVQVPIEVTSRAPLNASQLSLEIVFQLLDTNGQALTPLNGVPVRSVLSADGPTRLRGSAIIPRSDLNGIQQGGSLHYFFRARQSGQDTILGKSGLSSAPSIQAQAPQDLYKVSIIDTLQVPVSPQGSLVKVPDLSVNDGRTAINFESGALSNSGFLTIHQEDINKWPAGPHGALPLQVYSFKLEGTSLSRAAQLTFSYPAEVDGKVSSVPLVNPLDLAPFWWDSFEWRLLSKPNIDTTLHTVTAPTTKLATFALFPSGQIASADLRPREKIITPNGDGHNDIVSFGDGIDEITIFDIRGRRVRTITQPVSGFGLAWDGKDDDGKIVESGVYVYQFTTQGERISGVIAVAK